MAPHRIAATAILLVALASASCYHDLRYGIIPNRITMPFLISGIAVNGILGGLGGLSASLTGCAMGTSLLIIPFLLHMVGGGDVKFLGASGALLGYHPLWWGFVLGAIIGGMLGAIKLLAGEGKAKSGHPLLLMWWRIHSSLLCRRCHPPTGAKKMDAGHLIPYSVPLSLGIIICFTLFSL